MKATQFTSSNRFAATPLTAPVLLGIILFAVAALTGCSSAGTGSQIPTPRGDTKVTVLLSSTANDQLQEFGLVFQSITLTRQSGTKVILFSGLSGAEFIDINGGVQPFATATIPQETYTSARVTLGSAQFTCVTLAPSSAPYPGGIATSTFAYNQTPAANVSVNLPSPIVVTGKSMGLLLDLQVAPSATYPSCYTQGLSAFSINPNFNMTAVKLSSQPNNPRNGKVSGIAGEITAIDAANGTFTIAEPEGALTCPCPGANSLSVSADNSTVFQGAGSFSSLAVGTLVDVDAAIQADGSLRAMRVAAYDSIATNVMTGPLLFVSSAVPDFYLMGRKQQGQDYSARGRSMGLYALSSSTVFQTSGQFSNVATLPFSAVFDGSNMIAGQNMSVFSQSIVSQYTGATTITLMPQTVNGTVLSATPSGGFTDYTVSLAPDNLFPTLAVQPGQTTLLSNPTVMEIYVDGSVQRLNSQPLASGSTLRFNGLVFNDSGTLRMDCAQVNDGVTASSQSNSVGSQAGLVRTTQHVSNGGAQTMTTTTLTH